jgi:type II secretory pathway pseudopilin PulG
VHNVENEPDDKTVNPSRPDNADHAYSAAAPPARGTIRSQEPGVTRPRPATVAEARARDKARKAREVAEQFAAEQAASAQRRRDQNKKSLMGAVAVVGVVAVVALGYQMSKSDRDITATCVDENNVVVPDTYCASGTPGLGGIFIWAGAPYRYYYGGTTGGVGTRAAGGTLTQPSGTIAKTKSGSSITRGGFGSSSAGSAGG